MAALGLPAFMFFGKPRVGDFIASSVIANVSLVHFIATLGAAP